MSWTWKRRYAKPDMGKCESMRPIGGAKLQRCANPASRTVVGKSLIYPAYVCAVCAEEMVAQGYEAREGEWDVRRDG